MPRGGSGPNKKSLPAKAKGLIPNHEKFVAEYLIDLNAVQAYCRAYHPELHPIDNKHPQFDSIRVCGNALRRKEDVARAIDKAFAGSGVTRAWIVEQFAKIAQFDIAECFDDKGRLKSVRDMPADIRYAIVGVSQGEFGIEYKIADKLGALNSLAKALRMFIERVEHSGPDGVPLVDPKVSALALLDQISSRLPAQKQGDGSNA